MKNFISIMMLLLVMPLSLFAQESESEEFDSDRPSRAQGTIIVPTATVQIESGFEFQKDETSFTDKKEYLYPTTLVRIGILKNAELRINADYKKEKNQVMNGSAGDTKEVTEGFTEVQVGTKVKLYEGDGLIPQIGILGQVTLPVGNESLRPPHAAPEGRLLFTSKFSEKFDLQYNVGYSKQKEEEEFRGETLYAVTGNLKLTDKLTYFAEVFGQKPKADKAEHGVDTGFLLKLLPNLQLDVIGAYGLNEEAPDYFAGGGVTWRIPR